MFLEAFVCSQGGRADRPPKADSPWKADPLEGRPPGRQTPLEGRPPFQNAHPRKAHPLEGRPLPITDI